MKKTCPTYARKMLDDRGHEEGGGVQGTVVKVDFFDEAGGQLVVGEEDVPGGVDARMTVLAKRPELQGAEDGEAFAGSGHGVVGLEDVGPDDRVA